MGGVVRDFLASRYKRRKLNKKKRESFHSFTVCIKFLNSMIIQLGFDSNIARTDTDEFPRSIYVFPRNVHRRVYSSRRKSIGYVPCV